jgi:hypothetical protein
VIGFLDVADASVDGRAAPAGGDKVGEDQRMIADALEGIPQHEAPPSERLWVPRIAQEAKSNWSTSRQSVVYGGGDHGLCQEER